MSQTATVERVGELGQAGNDQHRAGAAEPPDEEPVAVPLDVTFDLLSNERRRLVVRYLLEEDPTTLSDLAEHLASIENDKPIRELSSAERKRVYICLYQCHLPKLDDADVIDFDEHRKSVTAGRNLDAVVEYLPSDDAPAEPQSIGAGRYLALAGVGGALFVAQALLFPNSLVSGVLIGAILVSIATAKYRESDIRRLLRQAPT